MASLFSTTAAGLAMATLLIAAPAKADVLDIGLDLSASVLLVSDPGFAGRAADYLKSRILNMKIGDRVRLQTFGVYGLTSNIRRLNITISHRDRPSDVAAAVHTIVRSVPQLVSKDQLKVQGETNILGYLDDEAHLLNCASEPTEVVLVSDGAENSALVQDGDLILGRKGLPNLSGKLLAGCSMTILGIGQFGQGAVVPITQRLLTVWTEWAKTAGITNFRALPRF